MDNLHEQVVRLAKLRGAPHGEGDEAEAIGIIVGLAGKAVESLVRIADALEKQNG